MWGLVVILVHLVFGDETMPEEIVWETMALLPKGTGGYLGIGMVEVLQKVCLVVINF